MSPSTASEHRFLAYDATPIFYRLYAATASQKQILLIHGMGEHGGRYAHLAGFLTQNQFSVWAPDLRGFGRSGGARAYVSRIEDYWKDIEAMHALISERAPGQPIVLLGHSFGGLLASGYAALFRPPRLPLQAVALSSPLFGTPIQVPIWQEALAQAASILAPRLLQNNKVNPAFLTHDEEMLRSRIHDACIENRISARLYTQMRALMNKREQVAKGWKLPLLMQLAGDDRIVSSKVSEEFFASISNSVKKMDIYNGFYHEIFNESQRQKVFQDLATWLKSI